MRIQLLLTGDELMTGVTIDSNSAYIADQLSQLGLKVQRRVTLGDDLALLEEEICLLSKHSDLLIINGGLGPTVDDLTAQALANAMQRPISLHPQAMQHIEQWCERRNIDANDANRKQAYLPEGVELLANPVGSAVGFHGHLNHCWIMTTPGVPSELRAMMKEAILPLLEGQLDGLQTVNIERYHTFGMGESRLQQKVSEHPAPWPDSVQLGFRAGAPTLEVKLTSQLEPTHPEQRHCRKILQELLGDHVVATGGQTMAQSLVENLAQDGKTLTVAESCTGGLIASMLTEVPGSSTMFHAGFVCYANTAKQSMLGVEAQTLEQYGAVSTQVVIEMAKGALDRSGSDYVIAVSGIAGPDGGSPDKPVGTVCIAWGDKEAIHCKRLHVPFPRKIFQTMVAATGLDLIRRLHHQLDQEPHYLSRYRLKL